MYACNTCHYIDLVSVFVSDLLCLVHFFSVFTEPLTIQKELMHCLWYICKQIRGQKSMEKKISVVRLPGNHYKSQTNHKENNRCFLIQAILLSVLSFYSTLIEVKVSLHN